jgi:hypothetical protein
MLLRLSHLAWALVLFGAMLMAPTPSAPASTPIRGQSPMSHVPTEVRLRKLHLVRPDLIPYPIELEVYC